MFLFCYFRFQNADESVKLLFDIWLVLHKVFFNSALYKQLAVTTRFYIEKTYGFLAKIKLQLTL